MCQIAYPTRHWDPNTDHVWYSNGLKSNQVRLGKGLKFKWHLNWVYQGSPDFRAGNFTAFTREISRTQEIGLVLQMLTKHQTSSLNFKWSSV